MCQARNSRRSPDGHLGIRTRPIPRRWRQARYRSISQEGRSTMKQLALAARVCVACAKGLAVLATGRTLHVASTAAVAVGLLAGYQIVKTSAEPGNPPRDVT